jgi:hypothetical protein
MDATREMGDDASSAPINAALIPPAPIKANTVAQKNAGNGQQKKPQLRELVAMQIGVLLTYKAKCSLFHAS